MGRVKIVLDTSGLPTEIIQDLKYIHSQEDLDSEIGVAEVDEAILSQIRITDVQYIGEEE